MAQPGPINDFDPSTFDELEDQMGEMFFQYEQQVAAPMSLWMQNASDAKHLPTVHGGGFDGLFYGNHPPFDVQISKDRKSSSHKLQVKTIVHGMYQQLCQRPLVDYFFHATAFPNISVTSFLGVFFSIEEVQPNVEGCKVTTQFFVSKKDSGLPKILIEGAIKANTRILLEDKAVCERWAKGYRETGNWLPGEERIRAYAELYKETYGSASPS